MRNKATIWLEGFCGECSYMVCMTNKATAKEAYDEFRFVMDSIGIDVSNLRITEIDLEEAGTGKNIDMYLPPKSWKRKQNEN